METSRDNRGKVPYNMESSGHVHDEATLIPIKTIPVQSGCGTEKTSPPEVKHWSFSSHSLILLSELPSQFLKDFFTIPN